MTMKRRFLILAIAAGVFWAAHYYREARKIETRGTPAKMESPPFAKVPAATNVYQAMRPLAPGESPLRAIEPPKRNQLMVWEMFRKRFGSDLAAQFDQYGRLLWIKGHADSGEKARAPFRVGDSNRAIARAQEFLAAASSLIPLNAKLPMGDPIYQGDDSSGHVFFHEASGGVPLRPFGTISIDVGAKGELTGFYSDYVPELNVTNAAKLAPAEARARAVAEVPESDTALPVSEGKPVIWVLRSQAQSGTPEGRHAFEFSVRGTQVVVDAGSGEILFRKDRRVF